MRLRAAALAGALLVAGFAWPALGHSGNDRRPGAATFDLEVKINAENEPAFDPGVVADKFGNLYAVARKQTPASTDARAATKARASSWRWTSTDGGATWKPLPGEVETAPYGTVSDVAVDAAGNVYVYDAPLLLRWTASGLGTVTFGGVTPVPGASPASDPVLVARGDGDVFLLAGTTLYTSHDGGRSFGPAGYALPGAEACRLAADRAKSVYATCLDGEGAVHLHASHDNGATFTRTTLTTYDPEGAYVDVPPIAVTPDGVVHALVPRTAAFTTLYLMRSANGGRTWTQRRATNEKMRMTRLSLAASPDGRLGASMYITGTGPGWFIAAGIFKPSDMLLVVSFADHTVLAPRDGPPPAGTPGVTFLPDSRLAVTWTAVDEVVPDSTTPLLQDVWFVRSQRPDAKSITPNLARTPRYEIPPCTIPYQVTRVADWQSIRAPEFRARGGGGGQDLVAYAVDPFDPRVVYVSNGTSILRSDDGGCRWREVWSLETSPSQDVPISAAAGRVVSLAVPEDRREHATVFAVIAEQQDDAGRAHVLRSPSGDPGTFVLVDNGLPPAGAPGLFRVAAANPEFLYLTVGNHLYASEDAGASWVSRTPVTQLATAPVITALALDPLGPNNLYAVWSGALHHSRDGGRTWDAPVAPAPMQQAAGVITAVDVFHAVGEAPRPVAWSAPAGSKPAHTLRSEDDGVTWSAETASGLAGPVESAVHGSRADVLVVSTLPVNDGNATVAVRDRKTGKYVDLSPVEESVPFRVSADRRGHPTFYGMSPRALFRYAGSEIEPPPAPDAADDTVFDDLLPPPRGPVVTPARADVTLTVGERTTVPFTVTLPARRPRLDVVLLSDTSESMKEHLPGLRRDVLASLGRLARDVDLWVGVAQAKTDAAPPIYRRERDLGPLGAPVGAALERLDWRNGAGLETQLIGLDQVITGRGMDECPAVQVGGNRPSRCLNPPVGSICEVQPDAAGCAVRPGQQANWRDGSMRVVVHATDTTFRNPEGTPRGPDGSPDLAGVAAKYRAAGVRHVGIAVDPEGTPDLARMAALTGTAAPAAGLSCGSVRLRPGAPAVCPSAAHLDSLLMQLLRAQSPRTHLHVTAGDGGTDGGAAFESVDPHDVGGLDLTTGRRLTANVTVSCAGLAPGYYDVPLSAELHDERATAFHVGVTCVAPAVRRLPRIGGVPPLLPPVVPGAPAPPPPVNVNPNVQPQVQAQVQPQVGAASQEDEELAVVLAEGDRDAGVPAELVALAGALGMSAAAAAVEWKSRTAPAPARHG